MGQDNNVGCDRLAIFVGNPPRSGDAEATQGGTGFDPARAKDGIGVPAIPVAAQPHRLFAAPRNRASDRAMAWCRRRGIADDVAWAMKQISSVPPCDGDGSGHSLDELARGAETP